jgi:hypothetical protein
MGQPGIINKLEEPTMEMERNERALIETLLLSLARKREGEGVEITPCGNGLSVLDGMTAEDMGDGEVWYILQYNVGVNTHSVMLHCILKAEQQGRDSR